MQSPVIFSPRGWVNQHFVKFKVKQWRRGEAEEGEEAVDKASGQHATSSPLRLTLLFLCASFDYFSQQTNLTVLSTSPPKL